jgi:hypothetical protein
MTSLPSLPNALILGPEYICTQLNLIRRIEIATEFKHFVTFNQ